MKTYKRERHDIIEERKVLSITALAEFAERYGYYVVQSLLIFFLIEKFNISQELSASLVGTALAMIYISAIVGGYIAERLLGYYRAGLLGSALMLIGYFLLASASSQNSLCLGLGLICISSGLIKSNMAAFIGRFYDRSSFDDSRRDFGFNVFYMGINLGGFLGLVLATSLKDHFGYDIAFYSSLVVNLLMFIMLCSGYKLIDKHLLDIRFSLLVILRVCLILVVYISLLFYVFKYPEVANYSVLASAIVSIFILLISIKKSSVRKVIAASVFFLLSIVYWALYFQMFICLLLFVEYSVKQYLLNSGQILSVVSLTILAFAVIMGRLWIYLAKKDRMTNDIDKFNLAFVVMALAFIVIEVFIYATPGSIKVSPFAFIIGYFIIGISELCISAIGLSLVTKIAPKGFVALYMGIWLITLGIGGKLGGVLSSYFYIPETDVVLAKTNMADALDAFVLIAVLASLAILLLRKFVNKYTH
ncbi:peptide MFS transporter [Francisella adeliensis]|uniref:MFS transporter n=1 Tax=Francisella adeliensis TaxID=2007306 RepID=A0A2Z4XYW8_9GAMM|nr:peptide MFS transporter [Francisella adeliensis]AXA34051.1 MFS transporter [Francisella adeliensis]MBK2085214.1 peptide MFS transporter [Francisella adeliensis]MBK2096018.1 peptide MFS transporter [Francisella adeliensis]QIW12290.1 peptide MFS transporter [Francisella adeliensis]QIW14164.1 peptide MFS transporter [Francisella adeliensis]